LLIIFSYGWRKGLFFDYSVFHDSGYRRPYDLWKLLGTCLAYLINQDPFRLTEDDWAYATAAGWFPFTSLPLELRKKLLGWTRSRMDLDILQPDVKAFLDRDL